MTNRLGLIGGSGLYRMPALADGEWIAVDTPWGTPSDALLLGTIAGREVAFLPRHGRGHRIAPHEINYRANVAALKAAGCTEILAVSAVGGFHEDVPPGSFVLIDQYIDRTVRGGRSFFGDGIVAHAAFGHPTCSRLGAVVARTLAEEGGPHRIGGTMLVIEGPQFSTRAESLLHKAWGCDVVGMTGLPEARLAREAELCYASVAMVTDDDAWSETHVDVASVIAIMEANAARAQALVAAVAAGTQGGRDCPQGCDHALEGAVITAPSAWPAATRRRLAALLPRLFG
ncbi:MULTISPECIES: S-methyl-5'-thioadenosine phosphorylase [unclassified Sphingomonas]|uniref:S-methyl-5'-thioadenosine phosphorylase n=1 Tax=unclassified Sphingomonas TaxID=196159 RepID=UPI0006FAEC10|nr:MULTISPECIES: S-methyl-5'-thioadenosine phosphorylase [unclassified Sphingomonas]KQX26244.1 5'-methylthioadenosine phosphorylase [Sphingomonas sp. Root1294]KQY69313.1 5'-methylthioadenosine phosphorylase [Sphingomonas sp. Root50]KRB89571.1 5'-methylthioadenosine phosphorylase [Sphingomonas sp. Root720]